MIFRSIIVSKGEIIPAEGLLEPRDSEPAEAAFAEEAESAEEPAGSVVRKDSDSAAEAGKAAAVAEDNTVAEVVAAFAGNKAFAADTG